MLTTVHLSHCFHKHSVHSGKCSSYMSYTPICGWNMLSAVEIKVTLKVAPSQQNFLMLIEAFCFIEPLKSPWMSEEELSAWLPESQLSPTGVFGPSDREGEHLSPPRNRFSSGQYGWGGWRRVMIVEAEGFWRAPVLRLIYWASWGCNDSGQHHYA